MMSQQQDLNNSNSCCCSLSQSSKLLMWFAADINWDDWITARLKRAAARRTSSCSVDAAVPPQQGPSSFRQNLPRRQASVSLRTPSHSKAVLSQQYSKSAGNSRRSSAADDGKQAGTQVVAPARAWQVGKQTLQLPAHNRSQSFLSKLRAEVSFCDSIAHVVMLRCDSKCCYAVMLRRHKMSQTQAYTRLTHRGPSWSG
jgi:hypothetical protein